MNCSKILGCCIGLALAATIGLHHQPALAIDACVELPRTIQVKKRSKQCGSVPTVILRGKQRNIFSAAFRWDDGTASGQDRSPFALDDSSASATPYKTQRKVNTKKETYLCYGKFLNRSGFPVPIQLTVKSTATSKVRRYCVDF